MKQLSLILLLTIATVSLFSQNKKEISKAGIKSRIVKEIVYEKGLTKPQIEEETYYDKKGNLIEIKEINSSGKITNWMKYEYDANDNLINELTLNEKGKTIIKVVYIYKDELRSEKLYYNELGKLAKKKTYEYTYNQ